MYDQADYFRIPLLDGRHAIGQILEVDDLPPGTIFCALSDKITTDAQNLAPLSLSNIVAFVMTTPDAITRATWPLAGFNAIPRYRDVYDFQHQRLLGFPDMPNHDPAIIEGFMNAWHGLFPWDSFGDLFDQIKRADIDKPNTAT